MSNKVFIATSLDGYIAAKDGDLTWLTEFPTPTNSDGGFSKFVEGVDAIVMGRNSCEKVLSFDIEWPYTKKVFVLTNSLSKLDSSLSDKAEIVRGDLKLLVKSLNSRGYKNLYIDGGNVIQSFMRLGLIDELTITQIPIILGEGIPLFAKLPQTRLKHLSTEVFDNGMIQSHYKVTIVGG